MDDFIFVDAQFFFAPSEENEPLGKAVSISFVDQYPNFEHKEKILKNFEESGLYLLDYEANPLTSILEFDCFPIRFWFSKI